MHQPSKRLEHIKNRDKVILQIILGGIIFSLSLYLLVWGSLNVQIVAIIVFGILILHFVIKKVMKVLKGRGYVIISLINDILYITIGIPIIVLAIAYLPYSILLMLGINNEQLAIGFVGAILALQVASIIMVLRGKMKDVEMNIFQYTKYFFNIKRRIRENKEKEKKSVEVEIFFDRLGNIEDNIIKKRMESKTTFEEFNWKERITPKKETIKSPPCKMCGYINDKDSSYCSRCGHLVK